MKYPGILLIANILLTVIFYVLAVTDLTSGTLVTAVWTIGYVANGVSAVHNIHRIRSKNANA